MSDCAECGLPPCRCRCGLISPGTWLHVVGQLVLAQTCAIAKRKGTRRYVTTPYDTMGRMAPASDKVDI